MKKSWRFLLLALSLFLIFNFSKNLWQWPQARKRLEETQKKLQALKLKNWQLQQEKKRRESPEFIEEEIRNKLLMTKEGETIVVLPEEIFPKVASASVNQEEKTEKPAWRQWWELFN